VNAPWKELNGHSIFSAFQLPHFSPNALPLLLLLLLLLLWESECTNGVFRIYFYVLVPPPMKPNQVVILQTLINSKCYNPKEGRLETRSAPTAGPFLYNFLI
jgi:hypothetical protein